MIEAKVEKHYVAGDGWYKVDVCGKWMTVYKLGEPFMSLAVSDAERVFELLDAAVMQRHIDEELLCEEQ